MQRHNLIILVICQMISASGSIAMITLSPIIGAQLAVNAAWVTLPVSMIVIATAATTVPATLLMQRFGRSRGFMLASLSALVAVIVAVQALRLSSFTLFIVAATLFGINMAFTQQYRYAAAESVPPERVARAVSFVLVGAIGGAFLGPELVMRGQDSVAAIPYGGTMFAIAALYVVQAALFTRLQDRDVATDTSIERSPRPLADIVRQPVYIVAVLGGTAGWGLMTLIMTATPLSMHINDGHTLEQTAHVIRAHVLGMYVPSLVSGFLVDRFGVTRLMFAGAALLLGTSIVGLQGQSLLHYWWALILLGVGWNFLYVGGTTMLTYAYSIEERFRAQAVNEFLVFGTSATASLLAGTIMHFFGWITLMWIPLPFLVGICIALLVVRRDPLLYRPRKAMP